MADVAVQTTAGRNTAPRKSRFASGETRAAWVLLTPLLLLFAVSVIYPLFETIRLSFYDIRGLAAPKWTGWGNYVRLWNDPNFIHSLRATLHWTLACTAISVLIGWFLALACSLAPRATLPFRVMIFAAYGISETVSGFIWLGIYHPSGGMLNAILSGLGLEEFRSPWLGNERSAMWGVIAAYSWTQVGLPLMTCFAAIQAIPKSLMEAAYIDGASPVRTLRYIVMPLSSAGVRVAIFINLLGSLKAFDLIYVLTGGGPVRATETVGVFMFRESMESFKLGYGAAATVILLIAVLVVSVPAIMKRTGAAR